MKTVSSTGAHYTLVNRLFEGRYDLWKYDESWRRVICGRRSHGLQAQSRRDELLHKLRVVQATGTIRVWCADNELICCIPVATDQGPAVAVANVNPSGPELTALLQKTLVGSLIAQENGPATCDTTIQSAEHRSQSTSSRPRLPAQENVRIRETAAASDEFGPLSPEPSPVSGTGSSFKTPSSASGEGSRLEARCDGSSARLDWLAQLPGQVNTKISKASADDCTEKVLNELRVLIKAKLIVWLLDDRQVGAGFPTIPAPNTVGQVCIPDELTRKVLQEYSENATANNGICAQADHLNLPDADRLEGLQLMLIPVQTRAAGTGWIMALNPLPRRTRSSFGPVELQLMRAAAGLLAAQRRSATLLEDQDQMLTGVVRVLVNALDAKDSHTRGHSDRVAQYARLMAQQLGLSEEECEHIHITGLLHDIGKVGIPDTVLNKPGPLTDREREMICRHPITGHEILRQLSGFDFVLRGVLHHHEALNGTGYPHGLSGTAIPSEARILAVADAWDAMTSDRPYRNGMSPEHATQILRDGSGSKWDPDCVDAFIRCMDGVRIVADRAHSRPSAPYMVRRTAVSSLLCRTHGELESQETEV